MTTTNRKQEIVQSLNNLDSVQSEKVLNFINGLLNHEQKDLYQQHLKRKAIKEIEQALRQMNPSF